MEGLVSDLVPFTIAGLVSDLVPFSMAGLVGDLVPFGMTDILFITTCVEDHYIYSKNRKQ